MMVAKICSTLCVAMLRPRLEPEKRQNWNESVNKESMALGLLENEWTLRLKLFQFEMKGSIGTLNERSWELKFSSLDFRGWLLGNGHDTPGSLGARRVLRQQNSRFFNSGHLRAARISAESSTTGDDLSCLINGWQEWLMMVSNGW